MAKRLNYEIGFTGDTSQLKAAIQDVQRQLNTISSMGNGSMRFTSDLAGAVSAAKELEIHLGNAFNQQTGKLDLTKFQTSLKQSGTTLQQYAAQLQAIGPKGEQAFLGVAKAISKAELSTKRISNSMSELWTTMKNTVRWQLTSSMLHGFIGAVQTAYGYTKDLNRSLNDIRIVSGASAKEMDRFADRANKAAKALSTTTTEYTNASLIYYQQGLSDSEVEERTNATIKMANATRQSAEVVSDQMTAIWNNFDDGSKSLEYYGDVLTKLGAETASSSQEISQGLEKFVGVASQIGLSYEYATAALTTITAQTRQSADVVGTALKTLFSRLQGLSFGETLEDGTNLNKYSEALNVVGINIKDQNGELKSMDNILSEMGDKWNTLSKDQQMALAQTVAGVRQYTQLITLMDNWDTFEINVGLAKDAEGTLNEQAKIYAEGWEASRDRVKAAAEDVYDSLLNPEGFVNINNILTPLLTGTSELIDGMGGLGGMLPTLGGLFLNVFRDKAAQGMRDTVHNLRSILGLTKETEMATKRQALAQAKIVVTDSAGSASRSSVENQKLVMMEREIELQIDIAEKEKAITNEQREQLKIQQSIINALDEGTLAYAKQAEAARQAADRQVEGIVFDENHFAGEIEDAELGEGRGGAKKTEQTIMTGGKAKSHVLGGMDPQELRTLDGAITAYRKLKTAEGQLSALGKQWDKLSKETDEATKDTQQYKQQVEQIKNAYKEITGMDLNIEVSGQATNQIEQSLKSIQTAGNAAGDVLRYDLGDGSQQAMHRINSLGKECINAGNDIQNMENATAAAGGMTDDFKQKLNSLGTGTRDWATTMVDAGAAIMDVYSIVQAFQNLGSIWSNEDLSTGEKLLQTLSNVGMMLLSTGQAVKSVTTLFGLETIAKKKSAAASGVKTTATVIDTAATGAATVATKSWTAALLTNPIFWMAAVLMGVVAAIVIFNDSLSESEKEQQRLNESIQQAEDGYNKARGAAEKFKQEVSEYQDGIDALDKLTKGTQEYRDAVEESNQKARELIETYGLWDKWDNKNEDGLIEIDSEELEKAKRENEKYVLSQEVRKDALQLKNIEKQKENLIIEFSEQNISYGNKKTFGDIFNNNEIAQISQFLNALGDSAYQAENKLREAFLNSNLSQSIKSNVDTILTQKNAFLDLVQATDEQTSASTYYAEKILGIKIEGKYGEDYSEINGEKVEANVTDIFNKLTAQRGSERSDAMANELKNVVIADTQSELIKAMEVVLRAPGEGKAAFGGHAEISQDIALKNGALQEAIKEYLIIQGVATKENFNWDDYDWGMSWVGGDIDTSDNFKPTYKRGANQGKEIFESANLELEDVIRTVYENRQIQSITDKYADIAHLNESKQGEIYNSLQRAEQNKYGLDFFASAAGGKRDEQGNFNLDTSYFNDYSIDQILEIKNQLASLTKGENGWFTETGDNAEFLKQIFGVDDISKIEEIAGVAGGEYLNALDSALNSSEFDIANKIFKTAELELDTKELDSYAKHIQQTAKESDKLDDALEGNEASAKKVAKEMLSTQKQVDKLSEAFEDNYNILKDSSKKGMPEYSKALSETKEGLSNLLGVQSNFISDDFAEQHLGDIEAAANGSGDAIERLRLAMQDEIIAKIAIDNGIDPNSQTYKTLMSTWDSLQNNLKDIKVGAEIDEGPLIEGLNAMMLATGMSTEQMQAMLNDLGYEPVFEETDVEMTNNEANKSVDWELGEPTAYPIKGPDGESLGSISVPTIRSKTSIITSEVDGGSMSVPALGTTDNPPKKPKLLTSLKRTSTGSAGNTFAPKGGGSGGGGGGGDKQSAKPKKLVETPKESERPDAPKLEKTVDIYEDINNELDRITTRFDNLETAQERAWGTEKLDYYKKKMVELRKEEDVLLQKQNLAIAERGKAIEELQRIFGKDNVKFNADGNVINMAELRAIRDAEIDRINAAAYVDELAKYDFDVAASKLSEFTEAEDGTLSNKDEVNAFVQKYDPNAGEIITKEDWDEWYKTYTGNLEEAAKLNSKMASNKTEEMDEAFNNVTEAQETIIDTAQELTDNWISQADTFFEELTESYKRIYDFKELENSARDFFKSIEEMSGTALTRINKINSLSAQQAESMRQSGLLKIEEYGRLQDRINQGLTYDSEMDYRERQQEIIDELISDGGDLISFLEEYKEILPNAISAVSEEMAKFTEDFEHNLSLLESYKEIYTFVAKAQGKTRSEMAKQEVEFLNTQLKTTHARSISLKNEYNIQKEAMEAAYAEMQKYSYDPNGQMYQTWKNNYEVAKAAAQEAEQSMLSSVQESLEMASEIYLAEVNKFMSELEDASTNGMGFDFMSTKYDNLIKEEEKYLDAVNESYELTKLNSELQKEIDEANSLSATNSLKALKDEIALRKENGKYTQYDIDILRAKFELTKAQIALEEAQENKSTMRLVRNAQGNWNYVFSANQDEIDKAQQNYNDKAKDYYNTAKEGAKEALDAIANLQKETADTIQGILEDESLNWDQKIAYAEEVQAQAERDIAFYHTQFEVASQDMSDASVAAIGTFENRFNEAFELIGIDLDTFRSNYETTMEKAEIANDNYKNNIDTIARESGLDLDSLAEKTGNVVTATQNLAQASNDTAWQLGQDLKAVQDSALAYSGLATSIWSAVNGYKEFVKNGVIDIGKAQGLTNSLTSDISAKLAYALLQGKDINGAEIEYLWNERAGKSLPAGALANDKLKTLLTYGTIDSPAGAGWDSKDWASLSLSEQLEYTLDNFASQWSLGTNEGNQNNLDPQIIGSIVLSLLQGASTTEAILKTGWYNSWEQFLEDFTDKDIKSEDIQSNTFNIDVTVQDGSEFVDFVEGLPLRASQMKNSPTNKW